MKQTTKVDKFVPRVAKLDKNKYAAWVDAHVGPTWEMVMLPHQAQQVRICKKRRLARLAALELVALARKFDKARARKLS